MKKIIILLALAALVAAPIGSTAFAADPEKDAVDKFEEDMKGADEAGKIALIEGLAKQFPEGKEAQKALWKLTRDRSQAVAVAAIGAIGAVKDKKNFGKFVGLIDAFEDEPKLMAAAILALSDLEDKRAKDTFIDIAKKWLTKNALVASAAATGLGKISAKESVDELIKLLDLTYPHQSPNGPAVSDVTRKTLADSRPAIMGALSTLTGWDFGDPRAWTKFWDSESKRWKPGAVLPDMTKVSEWDDPGYGFSIKTPSKKWVFAPSDGCRISMSRGEDNVMQANVYIQAYDMSNYTSLTAEAKAQSREDEYRQSYKDIKEESWVHEPFRVGKDKGVMHSFTGLSASGSVLRVKNVFVVKDEFMYVIGSWMRSGMSKEIEDEIDKAIESFRFTY
jgi:hypothetical protein